MKKLIKLILAIGITLTYLFGCAAFMEKYYMLLYGKDAVYYTSNDFFLVQILAFPLLLGVVVFFWPRNRGKGLDDSWEERRRFGQKKKQKSILAAAFVIALLLVNSIFLHCYDRITPDGVEIHRLFQVKDYTWDDVDYYTLNTHRMDDTLSAKVILKDGKKVELLPAVLSTESDGFDREFADGVFDFLPELNEKLIEKNKPLKIVNEKNLLQRLEKYEVWAELAEKLIEACRAAGTCQ